MIIVRSQNKEVLVEAKALAVDNYEGTWYVGQEANSKELFNLGEYSTKEKSNRRFRPNRPQTHEQHPRLDI